MGGRGGKLSEAQLFFGDRPPEPVESRGSLKLEILDRPPEVLGP
jgi:hypothetical protein